jgi:hypothetical protein
MSDPNNNSSEEAAEFVATVRNEHVAMKTWYNDESSSSSPVVQELKQKYGASYPSLWKEVLNWSGWKDTRRAYLQHTQQGSGSSNNNIQDISERKRKSRWGSTTSSSGNDVTAQEDGARKSRRWGTAATDARNPIMATPQLPSGLLSLPGMMDVATASAHLTPEQQAKRAELQANLRSVNEKLSGDLDAEAARVDALPRGHRERSPSPPPSTCYWMV